MNIETAIWYKYDKATGINFVLVQRVSYGECGTIERIVDSACLVDGLTPYVPLGECTVLNLESNPLEYFESIDRQATLKTEK